MNARLWPELGLDRIQTHAVGLAHAIPASFTNLFVDDDAHRRLFQLAARPQTSFLRGALLVVDHDGYARNLLQFTESRGKFVAVTDLGIRRQCDIAILREIIREDHRLPYAFRFESSCERRNGEYADGFSPAGHAQPAVIKNLVCDVDARGNASSHSERSGVKISAVSNVLKDVPA